MLKTLNIQNIALIDSLRIDFGPGLNILTGETGAGKSIIIGALGLVLGDKAKSDVIRDGAEAAVVEAEFEVDGELRESIPNMDESGLLARREIHRNGRSRSFLNDSPVSNSDLVAVGDRLVDLHGQHDHQTLLKPANHLVLLDAYGVSRDLLQEIRDGFREIKSLEKELEGVVERSRIAGEKKELLEFQLKEISSVSPQTGEDEELDREERFLKNFERIADISSKINEWLYEGEGSALERMNASGGLLRELAAIDESMAKWASDCESSRIALEEIVQQVSRFASKIEFDPQRLEGIRERLLQLTRLKKKYGPELSDVLAHWEKIKADLSHHKNAEEEIRKKTEALENARSEWAKQAGLLSQKRRETAQRLEAEVVTELRELGMPNARFGVEIRPHENAGGLIHWEGRNYNGSANGIDDVEFHVSTNAGESPKPLADVASGGEISRIMLALKTVTAEADAVPVLVFDEIDTGISGRVARVVGKALRRVAERHQVICITHLPQIASLGDRHFAVEKRVQDGRTTIRTRPLDETERVQEIAKLLGGESVSEAALEGARELLKG